MGLAKLRERVAALASLSHISRWQGDQARYVGSGKNLFDLRRTAVVHNLHVLKKKVPCLQRSIEIAATDKNSKWLQTSKLPRARFSKKCQPLYNNSKHLCRRQSDRYR